MFSWDEVLCILVRKNDSDLISINEITLKCLFHSVSANSGSCQMCPSTLFFISEFLKFFWRKGFESGFQLKEVLVMLRGALLALISGCAFSWDDNGSCMVEINYWSC